MSGLKVPPVLTVIIGEGGSGGALTLAVLMRFGCWKIPSIFYPLPRGFASILWKDSKRAKEGRGHEADGKGSGKRPAL